MGPQRRGERSVVLRARLLALVAAVTLAACSQYSADAPGGASDAGEATGDGASGPTDDGAIAGEPPKRSCETTFRYQPDQPAQSVSVAGEWNGWDQAKDPLTGPDATGVWSLTVTLPAGAHAYKLVVDGTDWILDPTNPYSKYTSGVENSLVEVEDCKLPRLDFKKLDRAPDGSFALEVQFLDGSMGAGLDPAQVVVLLDGAPAAATVRPDGLVTLAGSGLTTDKHRLTVRAIDRMGTAARALEIPFWIEDQPFD